MLNGLFYPRSNTQLRSWFLFHLLLGFISTVTPVPLIIFFYFVLLTKLPSIFFANNYQQRNENLTLLLVYLAPFEIICRMANTSPIIPYELGKYLTFFLLLIGLINSKRIDGIGILIVLLLLPGIVIGWFLTNDYRLILFNVMGLINLGLGVAYFGAQIWGDAARVISRICRLIAYPLLTALLFAFFRTPDYDEISFSLGANFDTTGGFGSNQVSTAFGLGLFLLFYLWFNSKPFSGLGQYMDLVLAGFFFFQGLLTFSRGGVIGGVLGMVILLIIQTKNKSSALINTKIIRLALLGIPLIIGVAIFANQVTDGNLLLRYQGETQGTLSGAKAKDFNQLTTNRFSIFTGDLAIFMEEPLLGVGVNESRNLRKESKGVVAHVELSRLLAEHGILGLVIAIILAVKLFKQAPVQGNVKVILFIFFVVGLYTTFHAATRTFISPLLISLALVKVEGKGPFIKTD